MGDGYMCGRNVKMKESLSHFCGISFLPKWDFFFCGLHYDELRTDRLGKRLKEFMKRGVAEGMYLFQELQFVPQKNFLWKIPQGDLDSNPALEQNPDNISAPLN